MNGDEWMGDKNTISDREKRNTATRDLWVQSQVHLVMPPTLSHPPVGQRDREKGKSEGDDEDITANDTSTPSPPVIAGTITHARARQLNHQVSSLLSSCSSYLDCGDPCTLVLLRNQGEDREGKGLARVGFGLQKSIDL